MVAAAVLPTVISLGLTPTSAAAAPLAHAPSVTPLQVIHVTSAAARRKAAATTGKVSSLKVASETAGVISLTWKNPSFKGFAGVTVREATGSTAPKSATSGKQVATVGKSGHTASARGLKAGTTYSFAAFAFSTTKGKKKYGAATKISATTVIGPVKSPKASPKALSISLAWTNPSGKSFAGVLIRRAVGATPPSSPTGGSAVSKRVKTPGHTDTDTGLTPSRTYSYSLWAYDKQGHYSSVVHARVTTTVLAPPPSPVSSVTLAPGSGGHSMQVSWTYPTDPSITGVMVRRTEGTTPPTDQNDGSLVTFAPRSQTTVTDTDLSPSTTYSYAVFAANNEPTYANGITATQATDADTTPPGPVTGVMQTSATDTTISLSWINPTPVDDDFAGVLIFRNGEPIHDTASSTQDKFTDTGLSASTTYHYSIVAYDSSMNEDVGVAADAATANARPITALSATASDTGIALAWTDPGDTSFAGVTIRRASGDVAPASATSGTPVTDTASPTTTKFEDSDPSLIGNQDYSYALFAYDGSHSYATGVNVTVTTNPTPVTGVTATATDSGINLAWTNPSPADTGFTGVMIRRASGDTAPTTTTGTLVKNTTGSTSTYIDSATLTGNQDYSYAIFTTDGATNYATGVDVTVTTNPTPVTGVTATPTDSGINLAWTNPPVDTGFTGVMIRRASGDTAPSTTTGTLVKNTTGSTTTYNDNDPSLIGNADYSYAIFTTDGATNYATGVDVTVTTNPTPVTGVTATATDSGINLAWTNPPVDTGFTGVMIRRASGDTAPSTTTGTLVKNTTGSTTTYNDNDPSLIGNADYTYAIFTTDGATNYATGVDITVTTNPTPVTGVTATPTDSTVALSWTNPSPADTGFVGVMIRRAVGDTAPSTIDDGTLVKNTTGTTSNFTDSTGLSPNQDYSYAIFTNDGGTNYATGVDVTVTTASPSPVTDLIATASDSGINLAWSNPADSDFSGVVIRRVSGDSAPSSPTGGTPVASTTASAVTFTDASTLTGNQDYSYAVFARDGASSFADGVDVTVTTNPTPVTGVTATATDSGINLAWTNPSPADTGFTGVMIRRASGDTAPSTTTGTLVKNTTGSTTTYNDNDPSLIGNADYTYAIFTTDGATNYATGVDITVTTNPTPVTGVTATATDSGINLAWTNPSPADTGFTGVVIRRASGDTAPTSPTGGTSVASTTGSTRTFTDSGALSANKDYSYAIFTNDGATNYATGVDVTVTTNPTPVTGVTATPTDSGINLAWTNPSPADTGFTGVMIRRASGDTAPTTTTGTLVKNTTGSTSIYNDSATLTGNQDYSYAIFTTDGATNYATGVDVTVTTNPTPVTGVTATPTDSGINLAWTNPSPADTGFTGVMIRRASGDTAPTTTTTGTLVKNTTGSTSTYNDSATLTGNQDYSYAIFTTDGATNYATGVDVTVTTNPTPVTGVTATPNGTDNSVSLTWTNPDDTGFSGVVIRRAQGADAPTSPTDGDSVTDTASSTTNSYDDADASLVDDTQYTYALFAYDGAGNYAVVATVTVTTGP